MKFPVILRFHKKIPSDSKKFSGISWNVLDFSVNYFFSHNSQSLFCNLGIPRNSKFQFTMKNHTFHSQEFLRISQEFLGILKVISRGKLWNELPVQLRIATTIQAFKSGLKIMLFKMAYLQMDICFIIFFCFLFFLQCLRCNQ